MRLFSIVVWYDIFVDISHIPAANGGQLEMAEWLLEHGAALSERDNDGYSSVILAACGGSVELVRFFLERGASLQERNNNGDTSLLLAAYCGHVELVDWLLSNGSSVEERNNTGMQCHHHMHALRHVCLDEFV